MPPKSTRAHDSESSGSASTLTGWKDELSQMSLCDIFFSNDIYVYMIIYDYTYINIYIYI